MVVMRFVFARKKHTVDGCHIRMNSNRPQHVCNTNAFPAILKRQRYYFARRFIN